MPLRKLEKGQLKITDFTLQKESNKVKLRLHRTYGGRGEVGQRTGLWLRHSRVQVPSVAPFFKITLLRSVFFITRFIAKLVIDLTSLNKL